MLVVEDVQRLALQGDRGAGAVLAVDLEGAEVDPLGFARRRTPAGGGMLGDLADTLPGRVVDVVRGPGDPAVLGGLVDFGISFAVLLALMLWYGIVPTMAVVTIPLFIILALATALGVGLWLSALNVKYRDVRYTIPFLTQFWLFLTPVAYSSSLVPAKWRAIYGLNPMAGVVDGFRWALLGEKEALGPMLAVSVIITVALLLSGLYHFRRTEAGFADSI